jgi:cytochrome c-type biogenesis protein CcmH/NrfG
MIADLLRLEGRYSEATDQYVALLQKNPHALDAQFSAITSSLSGQPQQLQRLFDVYNAAAKKKPDDAALFAFIGQLGVLKGDLASARDAYAKQTQLQPESPEALQNYTLVLSDSKQYQQALGEAQTLLTLVQQNQQQAQQVQGLVNFLKQRAAGG